MYIVVSIHRIYMEILVFYFPEELWIWFILYYLLLPVVTSSSGRVEVQHWYGMVREDDGRRTVAARLSRRCVCRGLTARLSRRCVSRGLAARLSRRCVSRGLAARLSRRCGCVRETTRNTSRTEAMVALMNNLNSSVQQRTQWQSNSNRAME